MSRPAAAPNVADSSADGGAGASTGPPCLLPVATVAPTLLQSFSSVVGPNGSGKSNVIDAMLFVFGKRAKQLRLNKVSELIHNSTYHRNLEQARVSVHFQEIVDIVSPTAVEATDSEQRSCRPNPAVALCCRQGRLLVPSSLLRHCRPMLAQDDERYKVVPGSEFVISRTAHRNNTSNYYIDDAKSNFKEVTELLKDKGVDLDNNRFLILQVGGTEGIQAPRWRVAMNKSPCATAAEEGVGDQ